MGCDMIHNCSPLCLYVRCQQLDLVPVDKGFRFGDGRNSFADLVGNVPAATDAGQLQPQPSFGLRVPRHKLQQQLRQALRAQRFEVGLIEGFG